MDNTSILTLTGFSIFFGFLFGFQLGMKYEIEMKVTYHARPEITSFEKEKENEDKLLKVL